VPEHGIDVKDLCASFRFCIYINLNSLLANHFALQCFVPIAALRMVL